MAQMFKKFLHKIKNKLPEISPSLVLFVYAFSVTYFYNNTFFKKIAEAYPNERAFSMSLFIIHMLLLFLILSLICWKKLTKPILILLILISAPLAYFTDNLYLVFDRDMIQNIIRTDRAEVLDLLSFRYLFDLLLYGLIPALMIYLIHLKKISFKKTLLLKSRDIGLSLIIILLCAFSFNKHFASFIREQESIRLYMVPSYFIYSGIKVLDRSVENQTKALVRIGGDATIPKHSKKKLIIFVLGETARSDRFSLNGYNRETNPLLKKEDVLSFKDVSSCGTSTATSLPCMFSHLTKNDFNYSKFSYTENLLDILNRVNIHVLWRDNNSDSKGVALRVPHEDFKSPKENTICDTECRDEGMLAGLDKLTSAQDDKSFFIILHQMGNHGPAYFKRYPKEYEVFKPTCQSTDLGDCNLEEINNAYDNAILYTDYFLSKVISFLKSKDSEFETAMIYMSDHGESLGENGIYLHGLPYFMAPIEQKKVPLILWFGNQLKNKVDRAQIEAHLTQKYSHDNFFHTVLGIFEVETHRYDPSLNLIPMRAPSGK